MNPIRLFYGKFCYGIVRQQFGPWLIVLAMGVLAYFGDPRITLVVAVFFVLLLIGLTLIKVPEEERWGVFPRRGTMIAGFSSQQEAEKYIEKRKMEEAVARQIGVDYSAPSYPKVSGRRFRRKMRELRRISGNGFF